MYFSCVCITLRLNCFRPHPPTGATTCRYFSPICILLCGWCFCPHPDTSDVPCRYFSCVFTILRLECFRLILTRVMRPVCIFRVSVLSSIVSPFDFAFTLVYAICRSFSCVCFVIHCNFSFSNLA